jgi:penicillin-binding protein 1C
MNDRTSLWTLANVARLKLRLPAKRRWIRHVLMLVFLAALGWFVSPFCVSLPAGLLDPPSASPVILDRHGTPVTHLTLPDSSRSTPLSFDRFPPDLIACTLAAEDKRFYQHNGVDFLATVRATRDFFSKRRVVSGASTITQQLIKISSPPTQRNLSTKVFETLAARRLEMKWSKQQILTAYLNRLDYGNLRFGASEAARFYFQKPLSDLSLAECAMLAGLPQAPSRLNPLRHPEQALSRRNLVLRRLASIGKIDASRIAVALTEEPGLRPIREFQPAPWLSALTPPDDGINSAPKAEIRSTLDLPLQLEIESIVREETTKLKAANLRHAAVVVIHNPTGEILALVSSADWKDPRGGQINGALVPRSPGSTLKPFTYLLAMDRIHRTPGSILSDIPTPFRTPQGLDLPENYDHTYRGPVTLRTALACSLNVPALRELNALGGPAPLHQLLCSMGLTTLGPDPDADGLGLTIGNAPVRLLELTNAYATLARGGQHLPVVLFPSPVAASAVPLPISRSSIFLIADVLSDPAARAPSFPPGGPLDLPFRCAVKTGTSSDFRDNWCIGFTPEFTVGVWAGNFENQPMKGISGISGAGPVFHRTMLRLHREHAPAWFARPDNLVEITIDSRNGKAAPAGTEGPHLRREIVPEDRIPTAFSSADYDSTGKALLEPMYAEWFGSRHNLRHGELAMNPTPESLEPLRIITPGNGSTLLLDPEIPSGSDKLRPVTNLPGVANWTSPTLRIDPASPEPVIHLAPGTHILTATDPRTGVSQNITLHVKSL